MLICYDVGEGVLKNDERILSLSSKKNYDEELAE